MRLPSFSNLIAFDATARHGRLTSAAGELNVSQPAISRRIAALEADLGCALFDRKVKPLSLTRNGQQLFDVLRSGLSRLELVVERIRAEEGADAISVSAASGLAAYWLIPRLPEIQAAFPGLAIRIVSQSHTEEGMSGDLHIRFGDGDWPETTAVKILGEEVFPVASPVYLQGLSLPLSLPDLADALLLNMQSQRHNWYDWETWFSAAGAPTGAGLRTVDFDTYVLLVSAALAGQGVCLCWSGLLDTFLTSGALVRLTDQSVSSARGYFVTYRSDLPPASPIRAVADWLAPQR
jgi:DNA-binding transcriptional LysR family regulator